MSIWGKLGFEKPEVNIDAEIEKVKTAIARNEQWLREKRGGSESFPDAAQRYHQELQGLKNKLALLEEKKRHEEEKAGYR